MLQRGDSDFAWFRERAESLHSDSLSAYTEKMTSSVGANGAGLNPEPSQPHDRAAHDLPPKSYAAAVYEPDDKQQQTNGLPHNSNGDGIYESAQTSSTNGWADSQEVDGHAQEVGEEKVLYEKHTGEDGHALTSIKPNESYEKSLKHNAETTPRERVEPSKTAKRQDVPSSQLASGRKAGAGWKTSAYETSRTPKGS